MIRMEYPRVSLDGLPADEKVYALQRQVDILTYNLQIVLDSIEEDIAEKATTNVPSASGVSF